MVNQARMNTTEKRQPNVECIQVEDVSIECNASGSNVVRALDPIDIEIAPDAVISLIRPTGCGKSTLLNAVGGFSPLATGKVKLNNVPVKGITPDVGVVFRQNVLFPRPDRKPPMRGPVARAGSEPCWKGMTR